jgi:hypothetical protein
MQRCAPIEVSKVGIPSMFEKQPHHLRSSFAYQVDQQRQSVVIITIAALTQERSKRRGVILTNRCNQTLRHGVFGKPILCVWVKSAIP